MSFLDKSCFPFIKRILFRFPKRLLGLKCVKDDSRLISQNRSYLYLHFFNKTTMNKKLCINLQLLYNYVYKTRVMKDHELSGCKKENHNYRSCIYLYLYFSTVSLLSKTSIQKPEQRNYSVISIIN